MKQLISISEARDVILQSVRPVRGEDVSLADALGRTLAERIQSREDIPPFDNSAMDGFAVQSSDLAEGNTRLKLVGEVAAGAAELPEVTRGACARIMTGAPIPPGADAVVPVEETEADQEEHILFPGPTSAGNNVRRAGGDMRRGETVIDTGTVVAPPHIAVMAALGYDRMRVAGRPRVSIVTTGSELVDVGEPLRPGKIRDSNGPALAALVQDAGATTAGVWRARDERPVIRRCLMEAADADVLVISGGVSVGEYDLVKDELDALGMELLFWKVRQRPGKPLAFGLLDDKPVFGLPGNPVSSAVCFEQYVRPALAKMMGRERLFRPLDQGVLTAAIVKKPGLYYFARGVARRTDSRLEIEPAGHQGSHVASSLIKANGFIHLAEELDGAPAGMEVAFEWFEWPWTGAPRSG